MQAVQSQAAITKQNKHVVTKKQAKREIISKTTSRAWRMQRVLALPSCFVMFTVRACCGVRIKSGHPFASAQMVVSPSHEPSSADPGWLGPPQIKDRQVILLFTNSLLESYVHRSDELCTGVSCGRKSTVEWRIVILSTEHLVMRK